MTRRAWAIAALVPSVAMVSLLALARNTERFVDRVSGPPLKPASEAASRLHGSSLVVDLHADSLLWGRDLARPSSIGHVDLPRLRRGNVALQVLTVVTRFPVSASIARTDPNGFD